MKLEIFHPIIFLGVGAFTGFGLLIAAFLLSAAVQLGFVAFIGALLMNSTAKEAASIGIIGGADGADFGLRPQQACAASPRGSGGRHVADRTASETGVLVD